MTYIVKTRGAGGYLVAEYRCPQHGIFEATVQRDENGDAPDEQRCPEQVEPWEDHGPAGPLDDGGICQARSPWTISAPKQAVLTVRPTAAIKGGDTERRPGMLDTRPLAEGMPYSQWKKNQREETRRRRHAQLIEKGVIAKKVQV